jgi:hypothetical protein
MSDPRKLCSSCGHVGRPKSVTPGSILIEAVLWLCLIVPGLIYSLWRINRRHEACAKCGAATLLPMDSPVAANFARTHGLSLEVTAKPEPKLKRRRSKKPYAIGKVIGGFLNRD